MHIKSGTIKQIVICFCQVQSEIDLIAAGQPKLAKIQLAHKKAWNIFVKKNKSMEEVASHKMISRGTTLDMYLLDCFIIQPNS